MYHISLEKASPSSHYLNKGETIEKRCFLICPQKIVRHWGILSCMHTLENLKAEFLQYIEIEKGRSALTVRNYDHYLKRFIDFAAQKGVTSPIKIAEPLMREYRVHINRLPARQAKKGQATETLDKKTQNYHLISLRAFFKYIRRQGIQGYDPERIELAKTQQRELDLINEKELDALLSAPDESTISGLRDKAILELFFSTGLRVSELCSLDRDVQLDTSEISVRGKGGKIRPVFISAVAAAAVKKYLNNRVDIDEALFIDHSPRAHARMVKEESVRLSPRSVERIVQKYAERAGIAKKCTPHVIRHSFATDLLYNGADLRTVQMLLGHSSIMTTQIYTNVTNKFLRDQFEKHHTKRDKK